MSRDTLGATGFESTNLDEQKPDNLDPASLSGVETLKGTALEITSEERIDRPNVKNDPQKSNDVFQNEEDEFNQMFKTVKNYKEGDVVRGVVSKIVNGVVYVDIAFKSEGIIEPDEISNKPGVKAADVCKIGETIQVKILRLENKAGNPVLSKKRADYELAWDSLNKAMKHNEDILVHVTSKKDGGINVNYEGIQAFIPNNQLTKEELDNAETLVGKNIYTKVLKVIRNRKKVILSHKSSQEKTREQVIEAMKKIKPGDTLEGTVRSIKPFGAFVNLGEFDGLVHISELSWSHIEKVEEVLEEGQKVKVYVLGIDESTCRISLSIKKLSTDPWEVIETKYKPGDKVQCTITRFAQFGAFAELTDGVEGLIHLTELSEKQVKYPEEVVEIGKTYEATILRLDIKSRKIGLTLRTDHIPASEPVTPPAEG